MCKHFKALVTISSLIFFAIACTKKSEDSCCKNTTPITTQNKDEKISTESIYQLKGQWADHNKKTIELSDNKGFYQITAMIFTKCGFACPRILLDLKILDNQLTEEEKKSIHFLLVSFDTERDTPEVLQQYHSEHKLSNRYRLLHGNATQVRELSMVLNVKYEQQKDKSFAHSNIITILNPKGEIIYQQEGLGLPPEKLINKIRADINQKLK